MTIVINGTTGISGVDGSAATPAVQGADTNTGVFYPAADTVGLATNGTERMRVDSSGNVGIGTASPSSYGLLSVVSSTAGSAKISIQDTSGGASPAPLLQFGVNSSNGFNTSDAARVWTTAPSSSTASLNFAAYNGGAPSTAQMTLTGGNLQFNSGYGSVATAYGCRAWVNFNGTGTVAIRASGNVTSITDNGVGDYTVNFTNAMPDANYSVATNSQYDNNGISSDAVFLWVARRTGAISTGSVRVGSFQSATLYDPLIATVTIFR